MRELDEAQVESIRENFKFFDRDNNGKIDFKEFQELLRTISPESRTQQAAEGFSIIDVNSDGFIQFDEFIAWWNTVWWEF